MSFSFKAWYEANGERLNEKRKHRYHTDPEYRSRVLAANQESRKSRKSVVAKTTKPKARLVKTARFRVIEGVVDGVQQQLHTIGAVAEMLGCSIKAIRLWEQQGVIPATHLRSGTGGSGDRLYTRQMIEDMRKVLLRQGRLSRAETASRSPSKPVVRLVRLASGRTARTELYLIGALARAVDRHALTLEQLEARGYLPRTPFRVSSVGRRLYTAAMIDAVRGAFQKRGNEIRGESAWKSFRDEIQAKWTEQGIIGASLVQEAPPEGINTHELGRTG